MKAVVSGKLFYREPSAVGVRQSPARITLRSLRKKADKVIRTARHHHVTMTEERTFLVNLGGIAEVYLSSHVGGMRGFFFSLLSFMNKMINNMLSITFGGFKKCSEHTLVTNSTPSISVTA